MRILLRALVAVLGTLAFATTVTAAPNPALYLATLQFDGKDWFDAGEKNFPQAFEFTPYDSSIEHNKEHLVRFRIGANISGAGSTGLPSVGPNDQRPAVYFHSLYYGGYDIYQYWYYFADSDSGGNHEHDWEKYFVYFKNGAPVKVLLGDGTSHKFVSWLLMPKDSGRPKIGVALGGHGFKTATEDGVKIRYDGLISKNNGRLDQGDGQKIPWVVYTNEPFAGAIGLPLTTEWFYRGDPAYSGNPDDYGDPLHAPWFLPEWNFPPLP
jgi:hypothetical protein